MTFDSSAVAREGAARSASRRRKLTLEDVTRDLPKLDSPETIRAALELLQRWGTSGMIAGAVMLPAVRACEIALRVLSEETDLRRVRALEAQVRTLQDELKKERVR